LLVGCSSNKSRLEEINEIIARSQVRAQQLLAAGSLYSASITIATTMPASASRQLQPPALLQADNSSCQVETSNDDRQCRQTEEIEDDDLCHITSYDSAMTEHVSN